MADQAFTSPGQKLTLEAAGDLSAGQFLGVVVNTSGLAAVAGAGVVNVGVLQNKPAAAGRAAEIMVSGVSKMVAAEAITAGDDIASDAAGKAVDAAAADAVLGIALTDAGADGEIFSVLLGVGQRVHP